MALEPQRGAIAAPVAKSIKAALDAEASRPAPLSSGAVQWLEKVRRFASFHGRRLGGVARRRFGRQASAELAWMAGFLVAGGRKHPGRGEAPLDAACLSAALYCADAAGTVSAEAQVAEAELRAWLLSGASNPTLPALGQEFEPVPANWPDEAARGGTLVLFSPNPFSLYSLALLHMALRLRLPVRAIVLRAFSPRRFLEEYRRDGTRLLRKIWRKLVLRADEYPSRDSLSLKDAVDRLAPVERDLRKLARRHGIPVLKVNEFTEAAPRLHELSPEIGLFTGGGMIDAKTIGAFSTGIINVHMGLLPQYKGMDVVQAPILEGRGSVGATAHLMTLKLDAGPILQKATVDPAAHATLGTLRNTVAALLPFLLIDSALALLSGRIVPVPQPGSGRQYYISHPRLSALIEEALAARAAPRRGDEDAVAQVQEILAGLP